MALTLHEKGRSVLKKRNYAEALLLLLEAEKEFRYLFLAIFCRQHPQWLNINGDDDDDDNVKGNVFLKNRITALGFENCYQYSSYSLLKT